MGKLVDTVGINKMWTKIKARFAELENEVSTGSGLLEQIESLLNGKEDKWTTVTLTGDVETTVQNHKEYDMKYVTSLKMTGAGIECHGMIKFAADTPTIVLQGFDGVGGDDINNALGNEVWEFAVFKNYIAFKNWGA